MQEADAVGSLVSLGPSRATQENSVKKEEEEEQEGGGGGGRGRGGRGGGGGGSGLEHTVKGE